MSTETVTPAIIDGLHAQVDRFRDGIAEKTGDDEFAEWCSQNAANIHFLLDFDGTLEECGTPLQPDTDSVLSGLEDEFSIVTAQPIDYTKKMGIYKFRNIATCSGMDLKLFDVEAGKPELKEVATFYEAAVHRHDLIRDNCEILVPITHKKAGWAAYFGDLIPHSRLEAAVKMIRAESQKLGKPSFEVRVEGNKLKPTFFENGELQKFHDDHPEAIVTLYMLELMIRQVYESKEKFCLKLSKDYVDLEEASLEKGSSAEEIIKHRPGCVPIFCGDSPETDGSGIDAARKKGGRGIMVTNTRDGSPSVRSSREMVDILRLFGPAKKAANALLHMQGQCA